MDVEERITALMVEAASPLMSLEALHRALAGPAEAGLRGILEGHPDRFVVLERPALFAGAEHWPAEQRRAYAEALRKAGFDTGPLVGARSSLHSGREPCASGPGAGDLPADSPAARLAASLVHVADTAPPEDPVQASLWNSLPLAEATMRVLAEVWRSGLAPPGAGPAVAAAAPEAEGDG